MVVKKTKNRKQYRGKSKLYQEEIEKSILFFVINEWKISLSCTIKQRCKEEWNRTPKSKYKITQNEILQRIESNVTTRQCTTKAVTPGLAHDADYHDIFFLYFTFENKRLMKLVSIKKRNKITNI